MFAERYKAAFELLERPLKARGGMDEKLFEPLHLPLALHEYYLVAGNEQHLNHSHNRLLAPKDIFDDGGRLVFMEENQSVVYWGVAKDSGNDPPVEQVVNVANERLEWHPEHASCTEFLEVMLISQANFGVD